FGLPREDLILYLRVPASEAQRLVHKKSARSYTTAKQDILEASLRHLELAADMYDLLSREAPWVPIQCFDAARGEMRHPEAIAQAATCERLSDDFCGECATCLRVSKLADPQKLLEQGLVERGESADAATVERVPLILQSHPDVWALVPDPVRLKSPVARPMLRVGQLRAVQRAAYFQPMGRRRVFILDGAETMRWDVANVFLKILEEPPGSATLILTAPSPYALLPTIVSRCLQFHFAPLPQPAVEKILKEKTNRKPAEIKLAAQLAEGSPGLSIEMDVDAAAQRSSNKLRNLQRAAAGQVFAQLFSDTSDLAENHDYSLEDQLGIFSHL